MKSHCPVIPSTKLHKSPKLQSNGLYLSICLRMINTVKSNSVRNFHDSVPEMTNIFDTQFEVIVFRIL